MDLKARHIYNSLKKIYRGRMKENVWDTCLVLARLNKQPSDLMYTDDINVFFFKNRIPTNILKGLHQIRPNLRSRLFHKRKHSQMLKISYFLAKEDSFKKGELDYWLQAERVGKILSRW